MAYTHEDVTEWKRRYHRIYTVSMRGVDYVFRELTYAESDEIVQIELSEGSAEAEDAVVRMALLHPSDDVSFDRIPAGVITSVSNEILEVSGFGSIPKARSVLDKHREQENSIRNLMKAFVIATMPAYKEEDLDELTFYELAKKVVLAEAIIKVNQKVMGIENEIRLKMIDPVEEAEIERLEAAKHAAQKKPGQAGYNDPIAARLQSALG